MSRGGFGTSNMFAKSAPANNGGFSQSRPNTQTNINQQTLTPESDYDVPAFLRNKLPKN